MTLWNDPDALMRLVYLGILLIGIGGFFLWGQRGRLARNLRDLLIWALIFAMVIIAYGFRDVLREQLWPASMVQVDAHEIDLVRARDGHFHATLEVNGAPIRFMIDTGASDVVLSRRDAERAGFDPAALDYVGRATTANGTVPIAPVTLGEVKFGNVTDTGVPASVNAGQLDVSLLGMSYLDRFSGIEIAGDRMRLRR